MAVDREVIQWIREAAEASEGYESLRAGLQAHDPEGEDLRLRPFIFAFAYALHLASTEARERAGGPFGAMLAGDGWRFPPGVEEIADDDVEAWREAFASIDHPLVQARLGDLLWVRRSQPDPHLCARAACDALLVLAAEPERTGMNRVRYLSRALELARETRDASRQATATTEMIALAEADLGSDDGGPGISLGALRPLVELQGHERPPAVDDLLQRVQANYGVDPYIVDAVADLRVRLLSDAERLDLRREQVRRWREESKKGDGMLRVARLEQALEIARTYGLREVADEIR